MYNHQVSAFNNHLPGSYSHLISPAVLTTLEKYELVRLKSSRSSGFGTIMGRRLLLPILDRHRLGTARQQDGTKKDEEHGKKKTAHFLHIYIVFLLLYRYVCSHVVRNSAQTYVLATWKLYEITYAQNS